MTLAGFKSTGIVTALLVVVPLAASAQFTEVPTGSIAAKSENKPAVAPHPVPRPGPVARDVFGAAKLPAPLAARAIGSYAKGCLAGAKALPIDGPAWQAMRLSRNRNWGHPELITLVERLALDAKAKDGWPGLLVGDIAQPRGGPMTSGHASHQIGLDADVWLTPMPNRRLTEKEREDIQATSMLAPDEKSLDAKVWTPQHLALIKRAASYPKVERILVHPIIKSTLCQQAGTDRAWLAKVRPYWGHHYHFHVRISCPEGSTGCVPQKPVTGEDGCGKELEDWFKLLAQPPKPDTGPPARPMTLDKLPAECRTVLETAAAEPAGRSGSAAAKK